MGTPRDPARERPGVRAAESASCPTQRRKFPGQRARPAPEQQLRRTLDAGWLSPSCTCHWVEWRRRPPGHGVGPPAQLGLESEQRSPSPHPEPGWTGPSLPQPAETMGADVLWGLGWRGRGLRRHLPSCRESWGQKASLLPIQWGEGQESPLDLTRRDAGPGEEACPSPWLEACPAAGPHVSCVDSGAGDLGGADECLGAWGA